MTADTQSSSKLYTPRMLMLSARLADFPLSGGYSCNASARSKTCGSTITIGMDVDPAGHVQRIGMQVTACAVGQSSAAILAGAATGASLRSISDTKAQIEQWLENEGPEPDWPEFEALLPVKDHAGRYGALLLPWTAAIEALSSSATTS